MQALKGLELFRKYWRLKNWNCKNQAKGKQHKLAIHSFITLTLELSKIKRGK
jgi:hypothetical protein